MTSVPCCLRDVYLRRRTISHKKQEPKLSRKTAEFAYGIAVRKPLNHFYGSGAEPVEKPVGFFDKVSCRTLRAPVVRLRRTTNTLASYIVFCVVYTPLRKIDLISFAANAANSARLF